MELDEEPLKQLDAMLSGVRVGSQPRVLLSIILPSVLVFPLKA
jgi:hypothetical protein